MTASSKLYDKIVLKGPKNSNVVPKSKIYRGFSTISNDSYSFSLYDIPLIKQDIINHFYIRQGERLENPTFGTIIWDLLYEPLTIEVKNLIARNVEQIINYDPRVIVENVVVTAYDKGIQIECAVTYRVYNLTEQLRLKFDQSRGLLN